MTPGVTVLRTRAIGQLASDRFDVLVVGGGITGAGVLLDAASRGLRGALIEAEDIAVGTSSRSSKLIHGGLRYLEQFRFGLVREALAERRILLRTAGHLVRLEPFTMPVYGSPGGLPYVGAGLALYGLLGAARDGGFPRYGSPDRIRQAHPRLRSNGLRGGFTYQDGVEDDARLAIAVVRSALARGAAVATRVRADELLVAGGRAVGVRATDVMSGEAIQVRANAVVDATGATGGAEGPFASSGGAATVAPSLGIHLVVGRDRIPGEGGLTIRVPGRVVFLIPWGRCWIIGTTDHPYQGSAGHPRASAAEVAELLGVVNEVLDVDLKSADIIATYAGLRPLAGGGADGSTVQMSREHAIHEPLPGLLTIRGGKYTTYRRIAAEAVDLIVGSKAVSRGSPTASLALVGAPAVSGRRASSSRPDGLGDLVMPAAMAALRRRYGTETDALLALGRERDLLRPLHSGSDALEVEVAWAVEHELAQSLDDILARRLRLAIETADQGAAAAPRTAAIAGELLGWTATRISQQIAEYVISSRREYGVPRPDRAEDGPRDQPALPETRSLSNPDLTSAR